jgi:hypothetical protein
MKAIRRHGGEFWQTCRQCEKRAQASLLPQKSSVLCASCARSQGVSRLRQPDKEERLYWRRTGKREWPLLQVP